MGGLPAGSALHPQTTMLFPLHCNLIFNPMRKRGQEQHLYLAALKEMSGGATSYTFRGVVSSDREVQRLRSARKKLHRLLHKYPNCVPALQLLAANLHASGAMSDAERAFRQLQEVAPNDPRSYSLLAHFLSCEDRHEEAVIAWEKSITLYPSDPKTLTNFGSELINIGRYAESVAAVERAIQLAPLDPRPHVALGNTLLRMGKPVVATRAYEKALLCDSGHYDAYHGLGFSLALEHKWADAARALSTYCGHFDAKAEVHRFASFCFHSANDISQAIVQMRLAIAKDPDDPDLHATLARLLTVVDEFAEADYHATRAALLTTPRPQGHISGLSNSLPLEHDSNAGGRPILGRQPDLHYLRTRVSRHGITFVHGKPMMGKTYLLQLLRDSFDSASTFLIGSAESKGENVDLLLAGVADLYARWLARASFREQFFSLARQHRASWPEDVANCVRSLVTQIHTLARPDLRLITSLVTSSLGQLVNLNKELRTGGLEVNELQYKQLHALLQILVSLTNSRVLLILDAWERSPLIKREAAYFGAFLNQPLEWSNVHIVVGLRHENTAGSAYEVANRLRYESPAVALYDLPPMHLDDQEEVERLISFIRYSVSIARQVARDQLLALVNGYPGVLVWWLHRVDGGELSSVADLQRAAFDAHELRYTDLRLCLERVLPNPALCDVACKLALLPELGLAGWEQLLTTYFPAGLKDELVALQKERILEKDETYPTYGHVTRHDTARSFFLENESALLVTNRNLREIVESTLAALRAPTCGVPLLLAVLLHLDEATRGLELSEELRAVTGAAAILLGRERPLDWNRAQRATARYPHASGLFIWAYFTQDDYQGRSLPNSAALQTVTSLWEASATDLMATVALVAGLVRGIARAESAQDSESLRRLFQATRRIVSKCGSMEIVRHLAGVAYLKAIRYVNDEQQIEALREFAAMAQAHCDHESKQSFMMIYLVAWTEAGAMGRSTQQSRLESFIGECAGNLGGFDEDGLEVALIENRQPEAAAISDLREYCSQKPENALARGALCRKLFSKACSSEPEEQAQALEELRSVSSGYAEDQFCADVLVGALWHLAVRALVSDDSSTYSALRDELVTRLETPGSQYQLTLATNLDVRTYIEACACASPERAISLLAHIRLVPWPEDQRRVVEFSLLAAIRGCPGGDRPTRNCLLSELRQLVAFEGALSESYQTLSLAFEAAISWTLREGEKELCLGLLQELRQLAESHPYDETARRTLASSLVQLMQASDPDRKARHIESIRELAASIEGITVEQLEGVAFNVPPASILDEDRTLRNTLMVELEQLAIAYPEDESLGAIWAGGIASRLAGADGVEQDRLFSKFLELLEKPRATSLDPYSCQVFANLFHKAKRGGNCLKKEQLLEVAEVVAQEHPGYMLLRALLLSVRMGVFDHATTGSSDHSDLGRTV